MKIDDKLVKMLTQSVTFDEALPVVVHRIIADFYQSRRRLDTTSGEMYYQLLQKLNEAYPTEMEPLTGTGAKPK